MREKGKGHVKMYIDFEVTLLKSLVIWNLEEGSKVSHGSSERLWMCSTFILDFWHPEL